MALALAILHLIFWIRKADPHKAPQDAQAKKKNWAPGVSREPKIKESNFFSKPTFEELIFFRASTIPQKNQKKINSSKVGLENKIDFLET